MKTFKEFIDETKSSTIQDLPVEIHKSPYEGADVGEHTEIFHGSPKSAQMFAKYIISKGATARIGKRGQDHYVYHNGVGSISKSDWRKTLPDAKPEF